MLNFIVAFNVYFIPSRFMIHQFSFILRFIIINFNFNFNLQFNYFINFINYDVKKLVLITINLINLLFWF